MMGEMMQRPPSYGIKRAATDELEREQRLTKRFNLLNLGMDNTSCSARNRTVIDSAISGQNGHKLYIPQAHQSASHPLSHIPTSSDSEPTRIEETEPLNDSNGMQVEDTPNRIYITDLDAEIASLEPSSPRHPIFLPDIEKHLLGMPALILAPSAEEEAQRRERERSMQLVVYGLPTSISIPEDRDNVRRAFEDTRKRVKDRMPRSGLLEYKKVPEPPNWYWSQHDVTEYPGQAALDDPDAMDIEL
jgi:hypothetical protein